VEAGPERRAEYHLGAATWTGL